jgi:hypothetical protein
LQKKQGKRDAILEIMTGTAHSKSSPILDCGEGVYQLAFICAAEWNERAFKELFDQVFRQVLNGGKVCNLPRFLMIVSTWMVASVAIVSCGGVA